ncbi:hypothetical protein Drose_23620 [Dactylosporangium roseum]|uniref:Secreted protein n=1 Tax=Dactylosporangium roseum TaxID=47989 RepID=A0ABY5Z024_9ACTN|nr:hypothetical protein [Dactylosporangium roseum]UWZ34227.1 hypothetical protein Drose_23620 [Dactylosporangium roseum]
MIVTMLRPRTVALAVVLLVGLLLAAQVFAFRNPPPDLGPMIVVDATTTPTAAPQPSPSGPGLPGATQVQPAPPPSAGHDDDDDDD